MERGTKIFKRMLGVVLAIVMCMTLTTVQTPTEVQAASGLSSYKRVSFYKSQKIGNTVYSMKYNDRYNRYTIYMRRNGKTRTCQRLLGWKLCYKWKGYLLYKWKLLFLWFIWRKLQKYSNQTVFDQFQKVQNTAL